MKALPLVPQIPGREREIRDASHFGAGQTLAKNRSGNQLLSDISFALILDFDGFLVTTKSRVRAFLAPKGKSGSISMSRVLPVKSATCRRDRGEYLNPKFIYSFFFQIFTFFVFPVEPNVRYGQNFLGTFQRLVYFSFTFFTSDRASSPTYNFFKRSGVSTSPCFLSFCNISRIYLFLLEDNKEV